MRFGSHRPPRPLNSEFMGKKATVVLRPGDEPDKLRAEIELKDQ